MFDMSKIRSKLPGNKGSKDEVEFETSIKTLLEMEQDLVIEYNDQIKSIMDYNDEIDRCIEMLTSKPELANSTASRIGDLKVLADISRDSAKETYKKIKEIRHAIYKKLHV